MEKAAADKVLRLAAHRPLTEGWLSGWGAGGLPLFAWAQWQTKLQHACVSVAVACVDFRLDSAQINRKRHSTRDLQASSMCVCVCVCVNHKCLPIAHCTSLLVLKQSN